ncbi:MotA/TolQ/ExbB proton channel family protein [Vibrio sp. SCSIO 43136]|uniref:MotA/TolQ/ExbB proton channel family protein n=1 Tax=Vibrio sp. SCSIO 43136 TaxID=2819101 RepID=UPI002074C7DC|nr:MotA/TolQ/ExbB proton channel family protein [Vibrio sp. SCSIO 43136]USD67018.1 MotA/TolQ/ExbB proton channel family protein [Vibrio sp. SCSIO 43136]
MEISLTDLSQLNIWWLALEQFMARGGVLLWWLAGAVTICWVLIFERILFIWGSFPKLSRQWQQKWDARQDHTSWRAKAIRNGWVATAEIKLNQSLNLIKVLVAICPMLGLLGTVTGMISVFDVMATQGSSEPKLMAAGISLATIPTLAGMVAALSGMFAHARLVKVCRNKQHQFEKQLRSRQCV